ncbi:MAG: aminopeptidase P family protein [Planctomycetes bacterium]|nr:aminopeptidase P family protein [Planctomycetota bacterium]
MTVFETRRQRLLQSATEEGLDAVLVTNPINVTYLTGFSGEASNLILSKNTELLVSDGRFKEQIAQECPGLDAYIRGPDKLTPAATVDQLQRMSVNALGYESGHLTVADFQTYCDGLKTAAWKPTPDRVEKLRRVKDESEVAQIRDAIGFAERAFAMFRAMLRPGDTEKDGTDAIEHYVRRAGGADSAFAPIVAVGPRSALPHAPPSLHTVSEDPVLLIDWGAQGPFYKSDLTRILWTYNNGAFRGGRPPGAKLRAVYAVVLEAQRRAIAAMRPGASTKAVDAIARGFIADQGYGEFFNHGLGHGFGLQIHEAPFFRPSTDMTLEAGMVVTCEPGIYLPGEFGVRIEDDVLITPDGPEVLTRCPRELEECMVAF